MRISPLTIGIAGVAVAGLVTLAVTLSKFGDSAEPSAADDGNSRSRLAAKLRGHSVPRFETISQDEPNAPPPPPPVFTPPPIAAPPPPPATPQAELKERASKDGFVYREAGNQAVYVVQNGTKFHIKSGDELRALGYSWDRVEVVPPGALGFLRDRPPERTLMRERDQKAVYYYENGQKRYIYSADTFERLGHKWSDVKVVPSGALASEATGAPIQ